jgi:hypothetical protein
MDDSTNKCSLEFSANTLHPPPLHGKRQFFPLSFDENTINNTMSDLENEERQLIFFQKLVAEMDSNNVDLIRFLGQHGRGHMGWRGPSAVDVSNDAHTDTNQADTNV